MLRAGDVDRGASGQLAGQSNRVLGETLQLGIWAGAQEDLRIACSDRPPALTRQGSRHYGRPTALGTGGH